MLHSSVETSLSFWSCSPGPNPIFFGMLLVDKSILVFTIYEKYVLSIVFRGIRICISNSNNGKHEDLFFRQWHTRRVTLAIQVIQPKALLRLTLMSLYAPFVFRLC